MVESVFGIDLGTTNSVIAVVRDGVPQVLEVGGSKLLPSVVGLAPDGSLLVGTPARNQLAAFPERTIASAKRRMGSDHKFRLGDRELTPPEVSALILKELCRGAAEATGETVKKVVITVPAFFQDAQRNATRLAGEIAGLEVVRLINEPTAAALAFEGTEPGRERTLLVYDLGGGTFDVSVVVTDGELTEVLASHGDVQLGGDDFDALLGEWLTETLAGQPGWDATAEDPVAFARILEASERAKRQLTEEVAVRVREEFLKSGPTPVHLDAEVTREDFEDLIEPLLEQTLDSVHEALDRAGKTMAEIDDVVLVGGQTRTPRVAQRLQAITGHSPRRDVHPDLCVALGAAIAGAQAAGIETGRVLVDVTPYTFGVEVVEGYGSQLLEHRFAPVIERGTPLPVTRSETFTTIRRNQKEVDVRVLQGESRDARHNLLVGRFTFDQLPDDLPANSPVHFRFRLGLDGILDVEVTEPSTGRTVAARIEDATARLSADELAAARARTMALWGEESDEDEADDDEPEAAVAPGSEPEWKTELRAALKRTAALTARMSEDDRADAAELADEAEEALTADDQDRGRALRDALLDLCDYAEDL